MALDQVKNELIEDLAITTAKLANKNVTNEKIADNTIADIKLVLDYLTTDGTKQMLNNLNMGLKKIVNLAPAVNDSDAPTWKQVLDKVSEAIIGLDFQNDVWGVQVDNTLQPELVLGRRYIIIDRDNLHIDFGVIVGLENNDIVQYNGTAFYVAYDVSIAGSGVLVYDKATTFVYKYDGISWAEFTAFEGVTAGAGLQKSGKTIFIGGSYAIQVNEDNIEIKLADTTLEIIADGLRVNTSKISNLKEELFIKTLTSTDITNKYVDVAYDIVNKENMTFQAGGVVQYNDGSVFDVNIANPKRVEWAGKLFDGLLKEGWIVYIRYLRVL